MSNVHCLSLFFRNLEKSLLWRRRMRVTYTTKPTLWSLLFEKLAHKLSQSYQWTALFTQWRVSRFFDVFSKQLMARHPSVQSLFTAFVTLDKATAASGKNGSFSRKSCKIYPFAEFFTLRQKCQPELLIDEQSWSGNSTKVGPFLWQAKEINGVPKRNGWLFKIWLIQTGSQFAKMGIPNLHALNLPGTASAALKSEILNPISICMLMSVWIVGGGTLTFFRTMSLFSAPIQCIRILFFSVS